jgi:hypothetical protein
MPQYSRYPAISLGAEYLAMGHLLRRNILAYKAPPNNEGYDLICIHPNPRQVTKQIRVQVKSRLATDSDKSVLLKPTSLPSFDYLMVVYLNVGYFLRMAKRHTLLDGRRDPEILTIPRSIVGKYMVEGSKWGKVRFRDLDTTPYAGATGIDAIADELGIPYPTKRGGGA